VVVIGLAIGVAVGLLNGLIITTWEVQPFLVTLGTMTMARGTALIVSGGKTTYVTNDLFKNIFAKGEIAGIPVLIVWLFVILIILYMLISRTTFGRRIQAIGGNEAAAINSGIQVKRVKTVAYAINGVLSGVCGLIILGKLSSGLPNAGEGLEMEAIAAAVLGGTGFKGEGGNVIGTLLGALVIGIVINGLTLMGVQSYVQTVVKGAIIILIVVGSISLTRRKDT
jgi:ribose/xylose/arabinose/galactoside ABC-type transport system permease subunit